MVMGVRTLGCFGKFFASPGRQWPAMTVKLLRLDIRIRLQPFGDGNHKLSFSSFERMGIKKKANELARNSTPCWEMQKKS